MIRVLSWILRVTLSGGEKLNFLSVVELQHSKTLLIKHFQEDLSLESMGDGRFKKNFQIMVLPNH